MSFYGNKWSSTFSKVGKKRKFRVGTDGKMVAVKQKTTAVPKKKPIKKEYKEPSEREIFDRDVDAFKERMVRKGYTPRGKDVQREVNAYMNRHPLRESAIPRSDKGLAPDNLNTGGRVIEQQRKKYLEFRQAKINTAIKKKRRK
jgi:hypothetical protein